MFTQFSKTLIVAAASVGAFLGLAATANADANVTQSERGIVNANGIVRAVGKQAVMGGQISAGAPKLISDGNKAWIPCVSTEYWQTRGQILHTAFYAC